VIRVLMGRRVLMALWVHKALRAIRVIRATLGCRGLRVRLARMVRPVLMA
jgi:hypothetical protein